MAQRTLNRGTLSREDRRASGASTTQSRCLLSAREADWRVAFPTGNTAVPRPSPPADGGASSGASSIWPHCGVTRVRGGQAPRLSKPRPHPGAADAQTPPRVLQLGVPGPARPAGPRLQPEGRRPGAAGDAGPGQQGRTTRSPTRIKTPQQDHFALKSAGNSESRIFTRLLTTGKEGLSAPAGGNGLRRAALLGRVPTGPRHRRGVPPTTGPHGARLLLVLVSPLSRSCPEMRPLPSTRRAQ